MAGAAVEAFDLAPANRTDPAVMAERLGLDAADPFSPGGTAAAVAAAAMAQAASGRIEGVADMDDPAARVAAEAGALYALANPDPAAPGWQDGMEAMRAGAVDHYHAGALTPPAERSAPGRWSGGWREAYPALSDAERALGALEGFAPGVKEAQGWTETFPAADPALTGPQSTGGAVPAPEGAGVVSTPVPDADVLGDGVVEMILPENPDDLVADGWRETSHPAAAAKGHRTFVDPTTGEEVRFDVGKPDQPRWEGRDHYHRVNPDATGRRDAYLDAYGNPVARGSEASHIAAGKEVE